MPTLRAGRVALGDTFAHEALWIAERCEHNALGDTRQVFSDASEIPRRTMVRGACRASVARMGIALLRYSYALEPLDPHAAREARDGARGLGWMQALVGDPEALDYRTPTAPAQMREDMRALAAAAATHGDIREPFVAMLRRYIEASRGSLLPQHRAPAAGPSVG